MKVENLRSNFLSNYEVFQHINDLKNKYRWEFPGDAPLKKVSDFRRNKRRNDMADLEAMTRDLSSYFNKSSVKEQSAEKIATLMQHLNNFDLMKIEKLQIINSVPYSLVHLYALVEECDQRFNEEECESILSIIRELFPKAQEEQEDEEEFHEAEENLEENNDEMEE